MSATKRLLFRGVEDARPLRVLCASGQLGYGIPQESFDRGVSLKPDFIGADMGSIDLGPYYLGSGQVAASQLMIESDLEKVLIAATELGVPLIIGSAGTAGSDRQLDFVVQIVKKLAKKNSLQFNLVLVSTQISPDKVIAAKSRGKLVPLGQIDSPSDQLINQSTIVAQCGSETFKRALQLDPDVLIVGRSCDTAIFSSIPEMLGYPAGLCIHMAKIIECSSLCCVPGGRDAIMAYLDESGFTLESMNPKFHATPQSVAAHALYEQSDPYFVEEPFGTLDLRQAQYVAIDSHRTRVSRSEWIPREQATLKVEGAYLLGYRSVLIAGTADPGFIEDLNNHLKIVYQRVKLLIPENWSYHAHLYGAGAIQKLPKELQSKNELGIVIEFLAPNAVLAKQCASVFKQNLLHFSYEGRICTAGNLAFPFTPSELDAGAAYAFSLYHTIDAPDILELFQIKQEFVN